REVSAVTGACLAVRREVFTRLHGFDEGLPGAYNDVDFCLRVREDGSRVLFVPDALLVHHEGASRGREDAARAALAFMRRRWGRRLAEDPVHHPGLDRMSEDVRPARPGPPGWLARQGGRARWLARDVAAAAAGWVETFALRPPGAAVEIALFAGAPVA